MVNSVIIYPTIGVNGQTYTVTIMRNPTGTLVSGTTYDYPILSNLTLTCLVTSIDGSPFTVTNYQWNTTGCFTNNAHNNPTCFPTNQTTQNVTGNSLLAEDAGTITCTITVNGESFISKPLTLRISGTVRTYCDYFENAYYHLYVYVMVV